MSRPRRLIDATAAPAPDATVAPDSPPPAPPREIEPDPDEVLGFQVDGEIWLAKLAGKGAGGTGPYGLGLFDAVHFARPDAPDRPLREALLARGRFAHLFGEELRALFRDSRPIVEL
jgi:hypothetical protein